MDNEKEIEKKGYKEIENSKEYAPRQKILALRDIFYENADKEHDKVLMDYLDIIDKHGGSFAMSNAFYNNGYENVELQEWAKKYKVHHLSCDYKNCHHQRKNIGKTDEVLITNY